ncbi:MAG: T9SS type A sorting domain-containing protein [Candidatus Cloacimonetes bacterium]|nr:T9SS type A sorting domain-containing protein [Candidatus Cloacimonadota bacterium]
MTINWTLTYVPNADGATNTATQSFVIPTGTSAVWRTTATSNDWVLPDTVILGDQPADTYTLSITSDPVGTLLKDGVSVGTTPYELVLDNAAGHYGTYSMDPVAGGTWSADLVIDETTVWPSVQRADYEIEHQFLWTADADTYQYKLTLNSPVSGDYAFGGPATGTTGVQMISDVLTEAANPYIGTYSITVPCPVQFFDWVDLEVTAADFALEAPAKNGGTFGQRVNNNRELLVYVGQETFEIEAIEYTVTFDVTPVDATINGLAQYVWTGTAAALMVEYTIAAPGYVTETYTVTAADLDGTVTIVLEEVPTYTVNMTTVPAGYITPATLGPVTDPADIYGTYTPTDVSTTGYWTPESLTIDADTEWVADGDDWVFNQEFVWTEVDSYTYNAMLNASDGLAYAFTGPQNGTTGVMMTSGPLTDPVNPLIGTYTVIDPPPAGMEWVNTTVELTADDFMMPAKEDFVYSAYGLFQLQQGQELLNYTVIVSAENFQAYSVNGPVSGTTTYSGSSTNVNTLLGDYTITSPPPAGFLWVATTITVGAGDFVYYDEDTRICIVQFQLEEELQPITYTLNIAIDDTVFPGGPYTINGNPYVTPIVDSDDQVNDLLGDYLISDPPAGYHWEVNPITVADGDFVGNVASIEFVLVEDWNPVELSSFTATLTGQFYVQLSWTSQTETQMMGYRVYRNTSAQQSSSELIDNPMIPATNTSTTQNYTVVDDDVLIGQTYYYWLEAVDYNSSSFHGPVSVTVTGNVPPVLPEVTEMYNAYPNPFKANGSTNIEVSLKAGDTGTLTIYNVIGQIVKTVNLTEGNHMVTWNGRDSRGNACGSGIYFYKLSTQTMNQTKKMVIVK